MAMKTVTERATDSVRQTLERRLRKAQLDMEQLRRGMATVRAAISVIIRLDHPDHSILSLVDDDGAFFAQLGALDPGKEIITQGVQTLIDSFQEATTKVAMFEQALRELPQVTAPKLSYQQVLDQIIQTIRETGCFYCDDAAAVRLGYHRATILEKIIRPLIEQGVLVKKGINKLTHYGFADGFVPGCAIVLESTQAERERDEKNQRIRATILDIIRSRGSVANSDDFRTMAGCTRHEANINFSALIMEGVLERRGGGHAARYILKGAPAPEAAGTQSEPEGAEAEPAEVESEQEETASEAGPEPEEAEAELEEAEPEAPAGSPKDRIPKSVSTESDASGDEPPRRIERKPHPWRGGRRAVVRVQAPRSAPSAERPPEPPRDDRPAEKNAEKVEKAQPKPIFGGGVNLM